MAFDQFCARIDTIAAESGVPTSYVAMTGLEAWEESFKDGASPEEAWAEEVYAAHQLG